MKQKVLYQKLGDHWYAFTVVNGNEILYTLIPKGTGTNFQLYEVMENL